MAVHVLVIPCRTESGVLGRSFWGSGLPPPKLAPGFFCVINVSLGMSVLICGCRESTWEACFWVCVASCAFLAIPQSQHSHVLHLRVARRLQSSWVRAQAAGGGCKVQSAFWFCTNALWRQSPARQCSLAWRLPGSCATAQLV